MTYLSIRKTTSRWMSRLLLMVILGSLWTLYLFPQPTLSYSDPDRLFNITNDVYYLIDSTQTTDLEAFRNVPYAELDHGQGILAIGYIPGGQVWVRFNISNSTSEPLFLSLSNRSLHFIECYSVQENGEVITSNGGTWHYQTKRRTKVFPLGKHPSEVLVRLRTKESIGTALFLSGALPAIQKETRFFLFAGATIWIPAILGFFALIGYLISQSKLLGLYALLQLGHILTMGEGLTGTFNHPVLLHMFSYVRPGIFTQIVFMVFALNFLELRKYAPRSYRLMIFLIIIAVYSRGLEFLMVGFSDLGWESHFSFQLLQAIRLPKEVENLLWMLAQLVLYVIAWRVLVNGFSQARFFILGFSFLLAGIWGGLLADNGVLPMHPFIYAFPIGMLTGSIFFAFALADRVNTISKEREKAQNDLIRQIQETKMHQQRLLGLRDEIARDLHDEMGSSLSSISILSEALHRDLPARNPDKLALIRDRARRVMDTMSDLVWSVDPKKDRLEYVFLRMREYTREILEPQGILVHFDFPKENAFLALPINQRKELYLIFKEAVNNCAKYSNADIVNISLTRKENLLELKIQDNGKGFMLESAKGRYGGNGLRNMQVRAEALQGTLQVITSPGKGAQVLLRFLVT